MANIARLLVGTSDLHFHPVEPALSILWFPEVFWASRISNWKSIQPVFSSQATLPNTTVLLYEGRVLQYLITFLILALRFADGSSYSSRIRRINPRAFQQLCVVPGRVTKSQVVFTVNISRFKCFSECACLSSDEILRELGIPHVLFGHKLEVHIHVTFVQFLMNPLSFPDKGVLQFAAGRVIPKETGTFSENIDYIYI